MSVYDINGNEIVSGTVSESTPTVVSPEYFSETVKSINHKGYCPTYTGNTKSAFIESYNQGFKYVECDIQPTTDGVLVIEHDVITTDYTTWLAVNPDERITLEQFLEICKVYSLFPYLEFKNATTDTVTRTMDLVEKYGLKDYVTYISFQSTSLKQVVNRNPYARVGFIGTNVDTVVALKTGYNKPFLDVSYGSVTDAIVESCKLNNIPLEVYTTSSDSHVTGLNKYVSGITCYKDKYEDVMKKQYA